MSLPGVQNHRAFVQKIKKQATNELRRKTSGTLKKNEIVIADSTLSVVSYNTDSALSEVVEPLEFEEYVLKQERKENLKWLVDFPSNDIILSQEKQLFRTQEPSLPADGLNENNPVVLDCLRCYTKDIVILGRKFEQINKGHFHVDSGALQLIPQTYEIDVEADKEETDGKSLWPIQGPGGLLGSGNARASWSCAGGVMDLRQFQPDFLLNGLLASQTDTEERDRQNALTRQVGRQDFVFPLYLTQDPEHVIEFREPPTRPTESLGRGLLLRAGQLKLDLEIEPIFATLALYDANNRRKISETFHFDLNSDVMLEMLNGSGGQTQLISRDVATMARTCLFRITYPAPDIFIIIRLEKVLQQGDIGEVVEAYLKEDKSKEKLRSSAAWCCQHLGRYRMPLAWTAIDLMAALLEAQNLDPSSSSLPSSLTGPAVCQRDQSPAPLMVGATLSGSNTLASLRRRNPMDDLRGRSGSLASTLSVGLGLGGSESSSAAAANKRYSLTGDEMDRLLDNMRPVTLTVKNFFRQESDKLSEEDLFKYLTDLKRPSSALKKFKSLPGCLELHLQPAPADAGRLLLTPEHLTVVTSSSPAAPTTLGRREDQLQQASVVNMEQEVPQRPVREMLEFPAREVYNANVVYRNLLYVYPRGVNFSGRQGSSRNIAIRLQLVHIEDTMMKALPAIFGKSNCPEFSKEAYTAVLYHNKTPEFYDEMKIQLPGQLDDSHVLLFTFYHVSCQMRKVEAAGGTVETVIGYSWLPLLRQGRLQPCDLSLLIALDKPSASLAKIRPDLQDMTEKYCLEAVKWVDNHKELFRVSLVPVSTVHPEDPLIDSFLRSCHAVLRAQSGSAVEQDQQQCLVPRIFTPGMPGPETLVQDLDRAVRELPLAAVDQLVKFSTPVFDRLLHLILGWAPNSTRGPRLEQVSFETLAFLVNRISKELPEKNDLHWRNSLITTYVSFAATIPTSLAFGWPHMQYPNSVPTECHQFSAGRPMSAHSPPFSYPWSGPGSQAMLDNGMDVSCSSTTEQSCPKWFHEELLLQMVTFASGKQADVVMDNAWFFFELLIRAMQDNLISQQLLQTPRRSRFSPQFVGDLASLVAMTTHYLVERCSLPTTSPRPLSLLAECDEMGTMVSSVGTMGVSSASGRGMGSVSPSMTVLNRALAFFLADLLSFTERGFVLQQVRDHCRSLTSKIAVVPDAGPLVHLKLDFLRILSSHEHFVQLNLPLLTPPGSLRELTDGYRETHFLLGLVLAEVKLCFDTNNAVIQSKASHLVWNLLASHELDPRYADPAVRSRVAQLYLPLIDIACDLLPHLHYPTPTLKQANQAIAESPRAETAPANCFWPPPAEMMQFVAGDDALGGLDGDGTGMGHDNKNRRRQIEAKTTRHLLLCCLWILKSVENRVLRDWLQQLAPVRVAQFLELLRCTATNFEYKGKKANRILKKAADSKLRLEENILGSGNVRAEFLRRKSSQPTLSNISVAESTQPATTLSTGSERGRRWRKEQVTSWRSEDAAGSGPGPGLFLPLTSRSGAGGLREDANGAGLFEGTLGLEVTTIVLDMLELVIQTFAQSDGVQSVLELVLRVLLHALSLNQCTTALQNLIATQKSLVVKFPEFIFEEATEQCGELCLQLLRHCSSGLPEVRAHAVASLYTLMRQNFQLGNNFARVKMQITMGLSSLVARRETVVACNQEDNLRRSLRTLLAYTDGERELGGVGAGSTTGVGKPGQGGSQLSAVAVFTDQVQDLIINLYTILSDTVKMREFEEDPEMIIDLMYRIAKGYQNSPDLRLRWLQNMANKHSQLNHLGEAAQCLLHSAALVAEYLGMMEPLPHLPAGCADLATALSPNLLEESAVSDDVVSPDEEGVCCTSWFTQTGLISLVEKAAALLAVSGYYELVPRLHRVFIPLHEANRDYRRLASMHAKMHDVYNNIVRNDGKRMFGTYFRVGFYGAQFVDLDGEEFIYKEPPLTKLPEIAHRLDAFYGERFGKDHLIIIKDSNAVEKASLEKGKAYIQITYVEPHFENYELRRRTTNFERNYNIKRFIYSTPFTMDGRAHGGLADQCKRKTILTTGHAFPYVKTRLSVVRREQLVLTPIEVAIEDLNKKVDELGNALKQEPPDPKFLQMVLQGSIGTTVNQGPVEMAVVFLAPVVEGRSQATPFHNKLRLCFKEFLRRSHDALCKNRQLITTDQKEYQKELERNYSTICEQLEPLLAPLRPIKRPPKIKGSFNSSSTT